MEENINDLRFNLSEDMNNMFIELIITKQILEDSLKEKRTEIIDSIKELIAVFEQLSINDNIELHYLKNREINDLKNTTKRV